MAEETAVSVIKLCLGGGTVSNKDETAPSNLLLGCSGWSYREWNGPFYPRGTDPARMLPLYARVFPTVEVNSTFYRLPAASMVIRWCDRAPDGFRYAAKLHQSITHERRLEGCEGLLEEYMARMGPLEDAGLLSAVLVQLPPSFTRKSIDTLAAFLDLIPPNPRFAVEFRHTSWYDEGRLHPDVRELLVSRNTAVCVVDEPGLRTAPEVTSDLAYVRWHGLNPRHWYTYHYSPDELATWVDPVRALCSEAEVVLGYFNNHPRGSAPANCRQFASLLDIDLGSIEQGQKTLTSFTGR